MFLRKLELHNIRSYRHAELVLPDGVTLLLGANAQGKTNLLEAVHRVATGGSHRVASDGPLVRAGAERGVIRAAVETDAGRERSVEIEVGPGRTRTRVDGQDVRQASETVGVLRVVLFAPEDVTLVRGQPVRRRRFLDELLGQRRPAYAATTREYNRVLRQRNQLLKQARELGGRARTNAVGTLDVWTDQLVEHGAALTAARVAAVHALAGRVDSLYRWVAGEEQPVVIGYRSSAGFETVGRAGSGVPERSPLAGTVRAALAEVREDELRRGVTLVGPHRDDLTLGIGRLEAREYASQGEAWSLALALRLASCQVLGETGDRPVVLLDDVFAELDSTRRSRLAEACRRWEQVIVTAAVEADVPTGGHRVDVRRVDGQSTVRPREDVGGAA